jgi:hypothetical protein
MNANGLAVAVLTAVFTLTAIFFLDDADGQAPPLTPSVYDKKLDRLDRRGIEAAYSSRVALLFQNWMTDTTKESSQRALRGHRNARQVYIEAMTGLDARDPEGKCESHQCP